MAYAHNEAARREPAPYPHQPRWDESGGPFQASAATTAQDDLDAHYQAYRGFVKYGSLFVLHVAVVLILMAYFLV